MRGTATGTGRTSVGMSAEADWFDWLDWDAGEGWGDGWSWVCLDGGLEVESGPVVGLVGWDGLEV